MNKDQQQPAQTALMAGVVGQVGCATVIVIAVALGAGFLLDSVFNTKPIFLILFLVGSVPVTMYTIVRVTSHVIARAQEQMNTNNNKEEEAKE